MHKHDGIIDATKAVGPIVWMEEIADALQEWSQDNLRYGISLAQEDRDPRILRASLMAEELGELIEAMSGQNYVKIADSIADLLYVVLGTAVCYNMDAGALFQTVHDSNMTKQVTTDIRVRDKGPNYVPPDIIGALKKMGFPL